MDRMEKKRRETTVPRAVTFMYEGVPQKRKQRGEADERQASSGSAGRGGQSRLRVESSFVSLLFFLLIWETFIFEFSYRVFFACSLLPSCLGLRSLGS